MLTSLRPLLHALPLLLGALLVAWAFAGLVAEALAAGRGPEAFYLTMGAAFVLAKMLSDVAKMLGGTGAPPPLRCFSCGSTQALAQENGPRGVTFGVALAAGWAVAPDARGFLCPPCHTHGRLPAGAARRSS